MPKDIMPGSQSWIGLGRVGWFGVCAARSQCLGVEFDEQAKIFKTQKH